VAVLAHPCFDVALGDLATPKILKDWGLDGLEALAPYREPVETRIKIDYFVDLAQKLAFLVTGGSDYHGLDGVGAGLGMLGWGLTIDDHYLTDLKAWRISKK
jgi:hypothetical protein